jgi:tetratricopeptide (TPR) repeat protein
MQYCMGRALYSAHRLPEARAALERAVALEPLSNWVASHLASVYAAVGELGKAREQVNEARRLHDAGLGAAAEVGFAYHALGDDDAAFEWLERAFLAREHWMAYLHLEPRVRDLHGTDRFDALLKRIGVATVGALPRA